MPSLQRFTSHGRTYWRIVGSYRRVDGRPAVRTLVHLGKVEDPLKRLKGEEASVVLRSVSAGAEEESSYLDLAEKGEPGVDLRGAGQACSDRAIYRFSAHRLRGWLLG